MTHTPDPDRYPEFYAGVPTKRFLAWVMDSVIIFLACLLILPFTAFIGLFFFAFLYVIVGFAYRIITLANGSATIGMRLMSMEIRSANDVKLDLPGAVLHTFGYYVSFAFPLLQVASIILMCTSARAQGLTDMVLGTVAINKRRIS